MPAARARRSASNASPRCRTSSSQECSSITSMRSVRNRRRERSMLAAISSGDQASPVASPTLGPHFDTSVYSSRRSPMARPIASSESP